MKRARVQFCLSTMTGLTLLILATVAAPSTAHAQDAAKITVVAGSGKVGYAGEGGPAVQALLNMPYGVAISPTGLLYFSEHGSDTVRRVNADGTISTVAGTGKEGSSPDGGPANQARLFNPGHIAFNAAGDLFITELGRNRVRKVAPDGIITTLAGGGPAGSGIGDNGPATGARLKAARGIAVDATGNVYIADTDSFRIRKVTPEGIITTFAGTGKKGYSGDGGPATEAQINTPAALALDGLGNLYLVEYGPNYDSAGGQRVRKINPEGIISTVASSGERGFSGDGGPATEATFRFITGIAVDTAGNLFITDWGNHRVRKVAPSGVITTVVGDGQQDVTGDGVEPTTTGLRGPWGLAIDGKGNLFIADTFYAKPDFKVQGERILKVSGLAAPGLLAGRPFQSP